MSTVGTAHAHTLRLTVPQYGQWRLDAVLEGGAAPAEGATVSALVGDLALTGRVLRAGNDAPDRPHVIVIGGLGWERPLATPVAYQSDAGIMLSTVLRDLAARAGETIEHSEQREGALEHRLVEPALFEVVSVLRVAHERKVRVQHEREVPAGHRPRTLVVRLSRCNAFAAQPSWATPRAAFSA